MRIELLIEKLKEISPDLKGVDVCVMDWRKNLHNQSGDAEGSGAGIDPDFNIHLEDNVNGNAFIAIVFNNGDYKDDGSPELNSLLALNVIEKVAK